MTGALWITIILHYFFNAIVIFYNFDLEDQGYYPRKGDSRLVLIRLMNIGFALFAVYIFYMHYYI